MKNKQKYFAIIAAILTPTIILASLMSGGSTGLFKGSVITTLEGNSNNEICQILARNHYFYQFNIKEIKLEDDVQTQIQNMSIESARNITIAQIINQAKEQTETLINTIESNISIRNINIHPGEYAEFMDLYGEDRENIGENLNKFITQQRRNISRNLNTLIRENNCNEILFKENTVLLEANIIIKETNENSSINLDFSREISEELYRILSQADYNRNFVKLSIESTPEWQVSWNLEDITSHTLRKSFKLPDNTPNTFELKLTVTEFQDGLLIGTREDVFNITMNHNTEEADNSSSDPGLFDFLAGGQSLSDAVIIPNDSSLTFDPNTIGGGSAGDTDEDSSDTPDDSTPPTEDTPGESDQSEDDETPSTYSCTLSPLEAEYDKSTDTNIIFGYVLSEVPDDQEIKLKIQKEGNAEIFRTFYPNNEDSTTNLVILNGMEAGNYTATLDCGADETSAQEFILIESVEVSPESCNSLALNPNRPNSFSLADEIELNFTYNLDPNLSNPKIILQNTTLSDLEALELVIDSDSETVAWPLPSDIEAGEYSASLSCDPDNSVSLTLIDPNAPNPEAEAQFTPSCTLSSDKEEYKAGEEIELNYNFTPSDETEGKFYLKIFQALADNQFEEVTQILNPANQATDSSTGDLKLKWQIPSESEAGDYVLYMKGSSSEIEAESGDDKSYDCRAKSEIKITEADPEPEFITLELSEDNDEFLTQDEDLGLNLDLNQDATSLLVNVYRYKSSSKIDTKPIATIYHHCISDDDRENEDECGLSADEYELEWTAEDQPSLEELDSEKILIIATAWETFSHSNKSKKHTAIVGPLEVVQEISDNAQSINDSKACEFDDIAANDPDFEAFKAICEDGYFTGSKSDKGLNLYPDEFLKRNEAIAIANRTAGCDQRSSYNIQRDGNMGFPDLNFYLNNSEAIWMFQEIKKATVDCRNPITPVIQGDRFHNIRPEEVTTFYEFAKIALISLQNGGKSVYPILAPDYYKNPWYADIRDFLIYFKLPSLDDNAPMRRRDAINFLYNLKKANLYNNHPYTPEASPSNTTSTNQDEVIIH